MCLARSNEGVAKRARSGSRARRVTVASVGSSNTRHAAARRRFTVHLALLGAFGAALGSSVFLSRTYLGHSGVTDHSIIGGALLAIVVVHLLQRRRTVRALLRRLAGAAGSAPAQVRLALSDTILWLLLLNALGSGLADYVTGRTIMLPFSVPGRLDKWHLDAALVLVAYGFVHVVRRRHRLRTSQVT